MQNPPTELKTKACCFSELVHSVNSHINQAVLGLCESLDLPVQTKCCFSLSCAKFSIIMFSC